MSAPANFANNQQNKADGARKLPTTCKGFMIAREDDGSDLGVLLVVLKGQVELDHKAGGESIEGLGSIEFDQPDTLNFGTLDCLKVAYVKLILK